MGTAYHFVTEWRVTGTIDEVREVLEDARTLPTWWPSVYLSVRQREHGGPDGVGRIVDLHTKGWLPYTLHWTLRITEPFTETGFALAATGDLEGLGRWTFEQRGPEVLIAYDWTVTATKPLLRKLSWLLRPAFSANHHWAMKRGEESLQLEIRRRRAVAAGLPDDVGSPPPPTFRRLLPKRAS